MNVLFLSQIIPYPPHGGVLQRGYNIIREISTYNNVFLMAFLHPDVLSSDSLVKESEIELNKYCSSLDYFSLWPKKTHLHEVLAYTTGFFWQLPFSTLAHRSSRFRRRMQEIIGGNVIDVVHFDTIGLAPYFSITRGIPTALTHHNIESSLMARRGSVEKNWLRRYYIELQSRRLRNYEIWQSPRFSINLMMSSVDEKALKAMAPSAKTAIISNGVDLNYFSVHQDPQEKAIVYTGGMNMFANADAVLHFIKKIWPRIKAKIPEAVFTIVGQDPPAELKALAIKDKSIHVYGYVEDIRPYVAKAAVYVVPIRVGGGTRLKVLDAMAQGKAIVSTSVGCEGIEVTDGVDICIENDDGAFADRVTELLNDPNRRAQLGAAARCLVERKYSWKSIGEVLQNTYASLVK